MRLIVFQRASLTGGPIARLLVWINQPVLPRLVAADAVSQKLTITAHAVLHVALDLAAATDISADTVLDAIFPALEATGPVRGLVGPHFWCFVIRGLQVVEVVELATLFCLQQRECLLHRTRNRSLFAVAALVAGMLHGVVHVLRALVGQKPLLLHAFAQLWNQSYTSSVGAPLAVKLQTSADVIVVVE